jgi:Zn-finger nucleic acid-binding protein/uncharacterized protein YbaR (Trm112 family)
MHRLVVCPACKRQYDASPLAAGSTFACRCGATVTVGGAVARDAAVVRCQSCGAAREEGALSCAYCGSDFTIHDQDLDTMCPSCFARISDHARFCHNCGTPIAPEDVATATTDRMCPACGEGHALRSRALGDSGFTALECGRCAGLFIGETVFSLLEERARKLADPSPDAASLRAKVQAGPRPAPPPGPFYRPCPVCATRMTRVNFERVSGILLDRCKEHGIWFDAMELEATLRFIKSGGERLASDRATSDTRARESEERIRVQPRAPDEEPRTSFPGSSDGFALGAIAWLAEFLSRRAR